MAWAGDTEELWRPTREVVERSRLQRFLREQGASTYADLLARWASDPARHWAAAIADVGIRFERPFDQVWDRSAGDEWTTWWRGGLMNIAASCLDQHLLAGRGERTALIWEGEPGDTRRLSYRDLDQEVRRATAGLRRLGVGRDDRVGLFLPLLPETATALLACARLGAVAIPLFSGFGAGAIRSRLEDGGAVVVVCADGFYRRGAVQPMKETADEAVSGVATVRHLVVVRRTGREVPWRDGRDVAWSDLLAGAPDTAPDEVLDAESPFMIIYTSGTTGRPKGAVHVHGGFPVKAAQDLAHGFDMDRDDLVFWYTDIGWMMGPWLILGGLVLGAGVLLYEGAPDWPGPDRLWQLVAAHRATLLGVSPTLVRALMAHGDELPHRHDLSSLRVLAGTGEPWNPEPFRWFHEHAGGGRLPVLNYSGGTEISGGIIGGNLLTPIRPTSFAGPLPGMAADVLDAGGRPLRGEVGELAIRQPWPGMTRGFWGDRDRYLATYWGRFPGIWVHGDWSVIAQDGLWYLVGRSDDTIKVAGKRLGPAEVESILVGHPSVLEAAAVGVPDALKGEALVCFVVPRAGASTGGLADTLRALVADTLGKPLRPSAVHLVDDLPRTRNAKILRRLVRTAYLGQPAGDLTSLENPAALDAIAATRAGAPS
ncbi:MAG: AMP-binding protein [Candidatus Dormiibacterota bacterium]